MIVHSSKQGITMNDQLMLKAIEISEKNMDSNLGGPFGAVIVKDGKIIAEGGNRVTSSCDPTAHAEVVAIRSACEKLENFELVDCEIYTSCEPCPMCLSAIYWARIKTIYYANSRDDAASIDFDDEFLYREVKLPLEEREIPIKQLLRDEAFKVFKKWEVKNDKIPY
jgi:guanine deaminase